MSANHEGWFTDLHTLNIRTGSATKQEVADSFRAGVAAAEKKTGRNYPYRFFINMPCNSSGQTLGFCYLYVSEPALYRMAIGLTPEGEPCEEKLLVIALPEKAEKAEKELEVLDRKAEKEPLVLDVNPCFVWEPDKPQLSHHILKSSSLPLWMKEEDLMAVFAPFSESEGFPQIKMHTVVRPSGKGSAGKQEKIALVTFNPATREGQFALHMRKKFEVADEGGKRFIFFDLAHMADLRRLTGEGKSKK